MKTQIALGNNNLKIEISIMNVTGGPFAQGPGTYIGQASSLGSGYSR